MLFIVHVGGVFSFCGVVVLTIKKQKCVVSMGFDDLMNVVVMNMVAMNMVAVNTDTTFLPIPEGIRGCCAVNQFYGLRITRADLHGITA